MSDPLRTVHALLTDAVQELDAIRDRLMAIAELLVEIRNREGGVAQPPDEVRHQQHMSDDHGPG